MSGRTEYRLDEARIMEGKIECGLYGQDEAWIVEGKIECA